MKKLFLFGVFALTVFFAQAQSVVGVWKSVDDETGEAKSNVQIYQKDGKVYGNIVALLRKNVDPNRICDKCTDWRKNQKIMQMMIVRDMVETGGMWKGGKILDPEKGKEYTCTMWFEPGKPTELKVRGWVGPVYRTQTWYRVK